MIVLAKSARKKLGLVYVCQSQLSGRL